MTGTRIHGYLITASTRESEEHKYETVFIYQDTEGKFKMAPKITDDVALLSWNDEQVTRSCFQNMREQLSDLNNEKTIEFWHTLS